MKIAKHYRPEACASTDPERFNITDPWLDVANERIVSTNGRVLVALPVETDKRERSRYLAVPLLKAARSLGAEDELASIEDQEIRPYGILWPAEQMGREFPNWQAAVPKFRRGAKGTITIALDANLLASAAKAMCAGQVTLTIELGHTDENPSPVVIQPLRRSAEEIGVLMPYRADGAGEAQLAPGQVCPICGKVLAAGAWCPDHGNPLAHPAAATAASLGEKVPAPPRGPLTWHHEDDGRVLGVAADGLVYAVEPYGDGWRWTQGKKRNGHGALTCEVAKKAAEREELERQADAALRNAGDGKLAAKELKGPAAKRTKKAARRA